MKILWRLTIVNKKEQPLAIPDGTCKQKGAEESTAVIRDTIKAWRLGDSIHTTKTLCNGRCKDGPVVISMPDGTWYKEINPGNAALFANELCQQRNIPGTLQLFVYGDEIINSPVQQVPAEK